MGLSLFTWNAAGKGLGYKRPLMSILLGGNVGHAAMELTWPANEAGDALAKKAQAADGIAISKRTEIVPEKQLDGNYKAKEQVVYFAYFSWWPGEKNGHSLNSFQKDQLNEWQNDPGHKIIPQVKDVLFGAGVPEENKTTVKGLLKGEKEIAKILKITHNTLKGKDIGTDPAYQQLMTKEKELQNEQNSLPKAESARSGELSKELEVLKAQILLCKTDYSERHRTTGNAPEQVIVLPTNMDPQALDHSLDTEKILDEMIKISEGPDKYGLLKLNCSTTAIQVVQAGITAELSASMKADGFDINKVSTTKIATPTSLSQVGQKLQSELLSLNTASVHQDAHIETPREEASAFHTPRSSTSMISVTLHSSKSSRIGQIQNDAHQEKVTDIKAEKPNVKVPLKEGAKKADIVANDDKIAVENDRPSSSRSMRK